MSRQDKGKILELFWRKIQENTKNSALLKFIKEYPRVSVIFIILLIIGLSFLPIETHDKLMLPIRALVIGFIIALVWWFYTFNKFKNKDD